MIHSSRLVPRDLREFFAFVTALGDPLVARDRRGADPADIDRLQQLAGRPLPPLYLEFLRELGERSLVPIARDGHHDVRSLLDYYEDPTEEIQPDTVVICTPAIEPPTLLVYRDDPDPAVFAGDTFIASSFAHQLWRCGWLVALWPNSTQLTIAGGDTDAVARSAERAGLEPLWFSAVDRRCLDDGPAQLYLEQQGPVARATVMSRRPDARARLADWLVRRHGARRL